MSSIYRNISLTYHNSRNFSMTKKLSAWSSWLLCLSIALNLFGNYSIAKEVEKKVYIVYMGDLPKYGVSASSIHSSMLKEVVGSLAAPSVLLYSYKRGFNGFAATLTEEEMRKMKGMDGVVSVFPNQNLQVQTTRSWDFLGFHQKVNRTTVESDVIIGMLDTGIWPESESFSDEGFGPPPSKWKGSCSGFTNFTCNNKIIGAKYYRASGVFHEGDIQSPRDSQGHGTHTSSIAAGREVVSASLLGLATGTARGAVPSSRIAVYKICWSQGCSGVDILAAFDDAIADGVDIISFSIGGHAKNYFEDVSAIGAFHAMKNGILTSKSAGNNGPGLGTLSSFSPWSLSVAATSIDRKFVTMLGLGNGMVFEGIGINTFTLEDYPLIYGGDAPAKGFTASESRLCSPDSLDKDLVAGKVVLCDALSRGDGAASASACGAIMADVHPYSRDFSDSYALPATFIELRDATNVSNYINSTRNRTANIVKTIEAENPSAPFVLSFSSRGPNLFISDLLKPDLAAPGVNILAAWSQGTTVTGAANDKRVVPFNMISGTSMSCPHATGAAAYIKSFHPTWSPAALRSALMTTASPIKVISNHQAEFAYGAGNINPIRAVDPGLIYDAGEADYIKVLCGQDGYTTKELQLITGDESVCSEANNGTVWDLNYPSFAYDVSKVNSIKVSYRRTVTNVGLSGSTYKSVVTSPSGIKNIKISVVPDILSFKTIGEKQSFVLSMEGYLYEEMGSGSLVWHDGVHQVRSPIVIYNPLKA